MFKSFTLKFTKNSFTEVDYTEGMQEILCKQFNCVSAELIGDKKSNNDN